MRKSHTSSFRRKTLLIAPFLMAGLTACTASDKSPSPQVSLSTVTSTVTATVLPDQKSGVDGTVSDKKDLLITPEGKGVLFLRLNGEPLITDEMEMLEGKLISGPGGCLSVQSGGRPELLIFTAGTKFIDHPPQVTLDGETIKIGEWFSLATTEVSFTDLTGVPERCSQGAAERAWVVGTN